MLIDDVKSQMLQAMKDKDVLKKEILRVALGELQTQEARTGNSIEDAESEKVLRKLVKSNQETIDASEDQAVIEQLEKENAVLLELLPQTLSVEEIEKALEDEKDQIVNAGNDGQAIGLAVKTLKSKNATVNGSDVATAVRAIRSA